MSEVNARYLEWHIYLNFEFQSLYSFTELIYSFTSKRTWDSHLLKHCFRDYLWLNENFLWAVLNHSKLLKHVIIVIFYYCLKAVFYFQITYEQYGFHRMSCFCIETWFVWHKILLFKMCCICFSNQSSRINVTYLKCI